MHVRKLSSFICRKQQTFVACRDVGLGVVYNSAMTVHPRVSATAMDYRYRIETEPAPDLLPHPHRFRVRVKKLGLASLLVREFFHYRGNMRVILSRPCVYGVFSGPLGGFAPRERLCVGCLRCTTQYPEFVQILPNPEREALGDSYLTPERVDMIVYEARTGRVPVKGAGYRGRFGGAGWDGMWTDMSEIVRPTRDGIHGREYISTAVDIGEKPLCLEFHNGTPTRAPRTFPIPIPVIFDLLPRAARVPRLHEICLQAAAKLGTLCVVSLNDLRGLPAELRGPQSVPLLAPADREALAELAGSFRLVELLGFDEDLYGAVRERFPEALPAVRLPFGDPCEVLRLYERGLRVFHLTADYHGRGPDGRFVKDLIREVHDLLVAEGVREEVTLIGSGGIVAAEHVPKGIICGLDAVGVELPLLVALQARFRGEARDEGVPVKIPKRLPVDWGVRRIVNLMASWRDQLLEVLGAMGMREVRRLRGEIGRVMFQEELEREAFAGIEGFSPTPTSL